ncbi:glycosyltransferase [Flavobacterium glaciei]|uniref:Glycosyltransferase involved in cell wall biosynthesis n=1 Tax=Flavobacterium glaciei TaxID=386300 RepID=A0A562Q7H0_9FLAO|nr:glycosyltransferase [Flavobacterium glaciei]RDI58335.1 glycosyltransferase involved in cell wall biosynthesis [Flavobacterium glaciei]TWI52120.1 glycosyltransferase involved in cell wall biosynthesis [Flavobacterium glaciei]
MSNITVSIFMLTYNQEAFIAQAIEGILMQKTTFRYQLVIGEDASTDTTRQICETYASQYGDRIKLLPSPATNGGLIANYMRTIAECDGTYIAICDGDDYWIDEYKLQKQVDFLDKNPDYSIVYTAVKRLYSDGTYIDYNYSLNKKHLDFDDLIIDNFIHSVTALFRNVQSKEDSIPSWIINFPFGDWQTYLWVLKNGGKIHFMDDKTAVYRMNIGVSSAYMKKTSVFIEVLIDILEHVFVDENFSHKKQIIASSILSRNKDLMTCFNREKDYLKGFQLFLKILKTTNKKIQFIRFYGYSVYQSFT